MRSPISSAGCKAIGVISALEAQGFEPGDEVVIAGVAFELDPGELAPAASAAENGRNRTADDRPPV